MQQIKFLPNNHIRLGKKTYKGYHVGELPPKLLSSTMKTQTKMVSANGLTTKVLLTLKKLTYHGSN